MFAFILAAAIAAPSPDTQSARNFANVLEQTRNLSAQLDDPLPIGMLVLMKLSHEVENVCPLGAHEINAWIKGNRLTEVESYVMGSLCESYWAGWHASYQELIEGGPQP
jgi:hypothetical protein